MATRTRTKAAPVHVYQRQADGSVVRVEVAPKESAGSRKLPAGTLAARVTVPVEIDDVRTSFSAWSSDASGAIGREVDLSLPGKGIGAFTLTTDDDGNVIVDTSGACDKIRARIDALSVMLAELSAEHGSVIDLSALDDTTRVGSILSALLSAETYAPRGTDVPDDAQ